MDEDAVDELMFDIIEIVNPIGDVLDEIEERFLEFKRNSDIIIVCKRVHSTSI